MRFDGSNGFRLMPGDDLEERAASGMLERAAGGHLTTFAYEWEHPTDGPQDGLLVAWRDGDVVAAVWGDSWHQQPAPMALTGTETDGRFELAAEYAGGWGWRIELDPVTPSLRMWNVVPDDQATDDGPAGPYLVMELQPSR